MPDKSGFPISSGEPHYKCPFNTGFNNRNDLDYFPLNKGFPASIHFSPVLGNHFGLLGLPMTANLTMINIRLICLLPVDFELCYVQCETFVFIK